MIHITKIEAVACELSCSRDLVVRVKRPWSKNLTLPGLEPGTSTVTPLPRRDVNVVL